MRSSRPGHRRTLAKASHSMARRALMCLVIALSIAACDVVVSPTASSPTAPKPALSPTSHPLSTSAAPSPTEPATASPQDSALAEAVSIVDFAFQPDSLTVHQGTTVSWTNYGSIVFSGLVMGNADHTVTFDRQGIGSGLLGHLQSYSIYFDKPGIFAYDCRIHERMHGTVTVLP
jgi:plastocyanin